MRYPGIEHGYDVLTILHQYFITDHLGNTRATIDTDGTLSGQADYLPYGKIFWENGVNYWKNRYLWTGKELLTTIFDGTVYDSGARFLFTDGSFASIDPYAEKYPWISPYAYCAGNPINLADPDGNIIETLLDVASLVDGVRSFVSNVKQGNTGAAIVDGIGIVFDAAAVITPFMPGGASMGIKAVRALDKGADAVKAADRAGDVAKVANRADDLSSAAKGSSKVKTYQTYTKTNKETGEVYVGRTSGTGTPEENVKRRDKNHHMNKKGFGEAVLDKSSLNPDAIRGQEQYMIDLHGGAKSQGGTSGNAINGVSPKNPKKLQYDAARRKEFGN